tara:strand:+ start:1191 stop:3554 length:2364 start_codon:yes stop_codon:yes gene_type:complete
VAVSNVELRVGATQAITALKNVNTQAQKFNQTVNGTNSKLKDANKALPILGKGFFGAGAGAKGAAVGFRTAGAALATALGPLTAGITFVAALGKTFANLAAQDFASAKVKTLGVDVDTLNPKLASLSNQLSGQVSQLDLLSASYDVASAGFGEVAELSDVLKASQLGATGGFSELATVADATTSVLNAYGLSSDQAAKLVDGFIQTQNDGKIVVDQYAQQIGRLAPIAAGAGVGIDELNAAISTVTATGVPVESTFAGLRQVIAAIQKPTSEAAKAAKELGIDFSATALSTKGLGGVLEELVAKGGASEETLAKFFGSVEARTAILPLLNDQLVSFNKNLENQANAQGTAAEAAFTASNTIQGQLTRLGTAFTNLTTEGSEIGIVIRESLKVAAVTVEALKSAFEVTLAPIRLIVGVVKQIGTVIGEALGIEATNVLFNLEQGWISIKEAITKVTGEAEFIGRVIGGVIGVTIRNLVKLRQNIINGFIQATQPVVNFFQGLQQSVSNVAGNIVNFFRQAFQKLVDLIPEPIKKLLGGIELPKINLDIELPKFENPFKKLKEGVDNLIPAVIEYSEVERKITDENNKQLDAKNKIVATNGKIETSVERITEAEKKAKKEADELKDKFMKIGEDIERGIVTNLTDAVMGTKSLADAATSVLNNLKRQLIELAIQRAVSGIGGKIGGFLGGLFGGKKERGGRVSAGGAFLVGERGPEILQMGSKGGNIIPNSAIGKGGGTTTNLVTVNVDASGSSVSGNTADANQLGQVIGQAVQAQLIKEKRAGGLLTR